MTLDRINPDTIHYPGDYTHVVRNGNTVYIAGQVARDRSGKTVGVGDIVAQSDQIFQNLQAALASVGGSLKDLAKIQVFMTHREDIAGYHSVREKYMSDDQLPVSTLVLVAGLGEPEYRIEVEAIAVVP